MNIEQLLQTKSKEEVAFILYTEKNNNFKLCCLNCQFFQQDKYKVWECSSLFENECRQEYYNWLKTEVGDIINDR